MRYIHEGKDLYKNDADKTWVATFQDTEDCKAVADSLNSQPEEEVKVENEEMELEEVIF